MIGQITGSPLNKTLLSNNDIIDMADALQEWIDEHPDTDWMDFQNSDSPIPFPTIVGLTQWFQRLADQGGGLYLWW